MGAIRIVHRHFTLLEILIGIAILSLVGGVAIIGIKKAVQEQHFRSEVSAVLDRLRLAQDLMLILGTDVRVVFDVDKKDESKGIRCRLEMETKLSPAIEREILRENKNTYLKTIRSVEFEDKESKEGTTVRFQSQGAVMSSGLMRLGLAESDKSSPGELQTYICLAGYPRHIFTVDDPEKAAECKKEIESIKDPALTHDTFSKIPELTKPDNETEAKETQKVNPKEKELNNPKKGASTKPSVEK